MVMPDLEQGQLTMLLSTRTKLAHLIETLAEVKPWQGKDPVNFCLDPYFLVSFLL